MGWSIWTLILNQFTGVSQVLKLYHQSSYQRSVAPPHLASHSHSPSQALHGWSSLVIFTRGVRARPLDRLHPSPVIVTCASQPRDRHDASCSTQRHPRIRAAHDATTIIGLTHDVIVRVMDRQPAIHLQRKLSSSSRWFEPFQVRVSPQRCRHLGQHFVDKASRREHLSARKAFRSFRSIDGGPGGKDRCPDGVR